MGTEIFSILDGSEVTDIEEYFNELTGEFESKFPATFAESQEWASKQLKQVERIGSEKERQSMAAKLLSKMMLTVVGILSIGKDPAYSGRVDTRPLYYDYLSSPRWKTKADAARERAGHRCQLCNRPGGQVILDVHHRTYERLFHEAPEDLTVLCRDCHTLFEQNKRQMRKRGQRR